MSRICCTSNRPVRPISVADNRNLTGWYDMHAWPYNNALDENPDEYVESARQLNLIIDFERDLLIHRLRQRGGLQPPEHAGTPPAVHGELGTARERAWASNRIIIAGFSQGAVMALFTGLTARDRLGGIICMSGYMPVKRDLRWVSPGPQ
jgi:pimeloyl-ACP methyl ester carboxylesterase